MRTLLTGANGLVGSTINTELRIDGRSQVDLRDWEETYAYFKKHKPEEVIHCAGRVGGLGANSAYLGEFFYDNMMINLNVLEAARRTGVKKVVSFLSTCIFPDKVEYPLTADKIHDGEPHPSNFGYAYSKRMLEVQGRAYREQYGLEYVSLIPTNIYGPNDNFNLESSHVVPALIHKCYLAKRDDTDFVVWGSGKPLREFIYSEDVGKITQFVLKTTVDNYPIILSTSEEISIREVVETIVKAMEFTGKVVFDDSKPDGQFRKPTSNTCLKNRVPNFTFTPFEEGIKKTVDWFVKNYEDCRK